MSTHTEQFLVTAAIDFGTTYSGYAYSHHYDKDNIQVNANWKCGSNMFKVPTAILFDKHEQFLSFGHDAERDYSGYADSKNEQDYYFFYRFKMELYNAKDVSRNLWLAALNGKKMKAICVFAGAIGYIKNHLMESINVRNLNNQIDSSKIQFVLTVPAIWSDSAKQFMREAAYQAGIPAYNLVIALEPECASIYCQTLPIGRLPHNAKINTVGAKYVVVDIGGGTVDITLHQYTEGGNLKELFKANGNDSGGTKVDQLYEELLGQLFTCPVVEHVKDAHPSEWLEINTDFEGIKRSLDDTSGKTLLVLKPSIHDTYLAFNEIKLVDYFNDVNNNHNGVTLQGSNRLKIPKERFKNMILEVTQNICDYLISMLNRASVGQIDFIILVGGFSNSCFVLNGIRNAVRHIPVIRPEEAELAVVRGAVLFGWKPNKIINRKCKKYYGISVTYNFKEGVDPPNLAIYNDEGVKKCELCFDCIMEMNESVMVGQTKNREYHPVKSTNREMLLTLHSTTKANVKYCNESEVYKVGSLIVKMPDTTGGRNRKVKVQLFFGRTELQICATDVTSGGKVDATFDFLTQ